jgi:ABC-type lipoprotein export system ATPase subunit
MHNDALTHQHDLAAHADRVIMLGDGTIHSDTLREAA